MTKPFLYHGQSSPWLIPSSTHLTVTIATEQSFSPCSFFIRCEPDNEEKLIPLTKKENQGELAFWTARVPLSQDKATTVYCFKAVTKDQQWWLSATGVSCRVPGQERQFRYNALHQPPEWVHQQIFYQIFPDRFANGNPERDVKTGAHSLHTLDNLVIAKNWGEPVTDHGHQGASEFFNGDLQGVHDKLDYLQELGITSLYLNPIFTSPSNHKYDTADYLNIDPHLGTNEEFVELVEDIHKRGMKIVLDAVFNHTSLSHPWFDRHHQRGDGLGAWQNPNSPYRSFYQFAGESDDYIGWNGYKTLPKLNFLNQEIRNYFYDSEDAVIRHWLKAPYSIDGWRMDVIHMLGEGEGAKNNAFYVKAFREAAKAENPESYLLGEHFFEATSWLQGDQEDGSMNYYGFAHPVRAFFTGLDIAFDPCQLSAEDFATWLMEAMAKIPWRNQLTQLNQLDSHDTMRFLNMANGDQRVVQNALMFLFCWVGVPCLYYGTEVALEGGHDPDNRRCFPWERLENPPKIYDFIKTLTSLRRTSEILQQGNIHWLHAQGNTIAFARSLNGEVVIYALNRGDTSVTLDLPLWQTATEQQTLTSLFEKDELPVKNGQLRISIPANTAQILL